MVSVISNFSFDLRIILNNSWIGVVDIKNLGHRNFPCNYWAHYLRRLRDFGKGDAYNCEKRYNKEGGDVGDDELWLEICLELDESFTQCICNLF